MGVVPVSSAVSFSSIYNFRDIGGYVGLDGRSVRLRRLYRSDSLHKLDASDQATFGALGVRTVIDLRRPREVSRDGRVAAYDGLAYRHIHPEHADWDETPYDERTGCARWLADRYLDLAESGSAGIATAIEVIAREESAPLVVHCVAGKDRTGVVCALTLSLLGVTDADIATDYALSTAAAAQLKALLRSTYPAATPVPEPYDASPPEAMALFLEGLRARYGSAERYLRDAGLTPDHFTALRAHLLN